MQALDFFAALAELRDHLVEVAAEVADFIVAIREAYRDIQVTATELNDLLLQFDHRSLHGVREHDEQSAANHDCASASDEQHYVALGIAPGKRREQKKQHAPQQNAGDRNQRLDFPVDA